MARPHGRRANQLRGVDMLRGFTKFAAGSVLIKQGDTHVLCNASLEPGVPPWREGQGLGWVTAEYDMLPASTDRRRPRNRTKVDGRSQEIQRLIGRSLRAVVDMAALGENTIWLDCDVLQADGGTRTASITGAFVAMADAVAFGIQNNIIAKSPIREHVAAVSAGKVDGKLLLDLEYVEDVAADVDCNVVMTGSGKFIEVQGTGEEATFTRAELDRILALTTKGIKQLIDLQKQALAKRLRR